MCPEPKNMSRKTISLVHSAVIVSQIDIVGQCEEFWFKNISHLNIFLTHQVYKDLNNEAARPERFGQVYFLKQTWWNTARVAGNSSGSAFWTFQINRHVYLKAGLLLLFLRAKPKLYRNCTSHQRSHHSFFEYDLKCCCCGCEQSNMYQSSTRTSFWRRNKWIKRFTDCVRSLKPLSWQFPTSTLPLFSKHKCTTQNTICGIQGRRKREKKWKKRSPGEPENSVNTVWRRENGLLKEQPSCFP